MPQRITTLLMFDGKAEEAMNFYVSLFKNAGVTSIKRYGPDEMGAEGSVMVATFTLDGEEFICIDSPMKHNFSFSPSISLFVKCATEAEIDVLFAKLSEGGEILMDLGAYPFSERFGWLADRYGMSWQLSLQTAQDATIHRVPSRDHLSVVRSQDG